MVLATGEVLLSPVLALNGWISDARGICSQGMPGLQHPQLL